MIKNILLPFLISFLFSACFSLQDTNPFLNNEKKREIDIPQNAPLWLKKKKIPNHISAIGAAKNIKEENPTNQKRRALIAAGNNLLKKIYSKSINIYKSHIKENENTKIFDNDIKKYAKQVSLKSLNISRIKHSWRSKNKELFVQIAIANKYIAQEIQYNAKKLFKTKSDIWFYKNFSSSMAESKILKNLEK